MTKSKLTLLLGSAGGLSLLVIVYLLMVGGGGAPQTRPRGAAATLPNQPAGGKPTAMDVADGVTLPGGGGISFTVYDEHSGRPTDRFRCDTWVPVQDSPNEVYVKNPELTLLLPSGMTATISAEEGQIMAERIQKSQGKPKMGWLRGDASIVIDRGTGADRSAPETRPSDLITIRMDRIEFDLELGRMRCPDSVRVVSVDYEIVGADLDLEFNRADNRVQQLRLDRGDHLVLRTAGTGFGGLFGAGRATATQPVAATMPAAQAAAAAAPKTAKKRGARPAGYRCVLTGDVVADQYIGEQRVGGLEADEIAITFDMGGSEDAALRRAPAASAPVAPATQASENEQRLVVHWRGPLVMTPADAPARPGPARRRFEAAGRRVSLEQGEGFVLCNRLEYFDETQQAWLYADGGRIEFGRGAALRATADSVYIDRRKNIVKLVGTIELDSAPSDSATPRANQPAGKPRPQGSTIRCEQWAELKLSDAHSESQPAASRPAGVDLARFDWARFAGNVRVGMSAQTLTSDELHVTLKPGQTFEQSLDVADARGNVRLAGERQSLQCARLHAEFAIHDGRAYPHAIQAAGSVMIRRGRTEVRGGRVEAELGPPVAAEGEVRDFALRTVDIFDRAELRDPENKVAARGSHIRAWFSGASELVRARVSGRDEQLGMVESSPYVVRGEQIDVDRGRQTVLVNGPSSLSFESRRGLSGAEHSKAQTINVAAAQSLSIDGDANLVVFTGDVQARSRSEQLQADRLTLYLQDAVEPAAAPPPASDTQSPSDEDVPPEITLRPDEIASAVLPSGLAACVRTALALSSFVPPDRAKPPEPAPTQRKEPTRVVAENAIVRTISASSDGAPPQTEAEIYAPNRLEADLLRRIITTAGQTVLLTTNRRLAGDAEAVREAAGAASSLIGGGPSQTAMQCDEGMTYTLGADGPNRRDLVLLSGGVRFVHRAGREMLNIEEVLPQLRGDSKSLAELKSRRTTLNCDRLECEFIAEPAADRGQAPGGAPLRLAWIMAGGSAYLRDQQGAGVREVIGETLEFSREAGLVRVRGSERSQARIYFENAATGQHDQPMVGNELVIDLKTNAVRAGPLQMEFHRP
ncbi:OstA-like protein [Phycisphaerae bacterium RAS1]|nr:OstA-like protein [Phycisphaerae bacterium RAS1]